MPIAPEVPGTVTEVAVTSNQFVNAGDLLFQIDRARYELAVGNAEVSLEQARQALGVSTANVEAARAQVKTARATLVRAQQDATRLRRIKDEDPGAISERRLESAEATDQIPAGAVQGVIDEAVIVVVNLIVGICRTFEISHTKSASR
mgnify:CR=1 FL=1